ncbi:right-handed parallel beta-helix repeat-containing protein [Desulfobacter latus]|uniref:Right handed beta helix domain-containing protein n=1 Tax=Desulfobacter latus TaxID=2292 RepID=A0A850TER4_9BACT|nr:pectinesterase family protein [Desulfobacter latus]NWH06777.1 hypothetical protein [Desulfobacter latus]
MFNYIRIFVYCMLICFLSLGADASSGDISGNGATTLGDAILGLKVECGVENIKTYALNNEVNQDNKIGVADSLYILQCLAKLRSTEDPNASIIKIPTNYQTISQAVSAAKDGDTIEVSGGIYDENVIIDKSIKLIGAGMDSTEINGSTVPGKTPCNDPVLSITGNKVVVAGFKITGGYPGLEIIGENAVIEFNNITNNTSNEYCPNHSTGGFYAEGLNGLGLVVRGGNCKIRNNLIVKNGETWDGGGCGIETHGANVIIENNTIVRNSGANGASCGDGYGILALYSSGRIINNIIADNDAWDGDGCNVKGYGIYSVDSDFQVDYNNVWDNDNGGWEVKEMNNYAGAGPGGHDIAGDPMFADEDLYRLSSSSPCIDAGAPNYDYSSEPEPNGGRVNIGAYGNTPHATCAEMPLP